jgi:hypothetical protein
MHWSLFISIALIAQISFGQTEAEYIKTHPYHKYDGNSYECEFKSKDKTISDYCDTIRYCNNALSSTFGKDSIYNIHMRIFEKSDSGIVEKYYNFTGRFKIDQEGDIILLGRHPFRSDALRIIDIVKKHSIYTFYYQFKLNDEFSWTYKGKLRANCDGGCSISKYEY